MATKKRVTVVKKASKTKGASASPKSSAPKSSSKTSPSSSNTPSSARGPAPASRPPQTPSRPILSPRPTSQPRSKSTMPSVGGRGDLLASLARKDSEQVSTTPIGLPSPEWLSVEGTTHEKRRFRRVQKDLKIRLIAGREGKTALEASLRSEDMSLSGIFLRSTFFVAEGTEVKIEFDAPWGQTASARGVVTRVRRDGAVPGFGVHFTELDEGALTDLVCIFAGDHIQQFVTDFARRSTRSVDPTALAEAILAWELARLRNLSP